MRHIAWIGLALAAAGLAQVTPPAAGSDACKELAALQQRVVAGKSKYVETAKELGPEFEAFAKRYAGTEEALTARLWLLQQSWWLREGESNTKMNEAAGTMIDAILAEFPDSKQLAKVAEYQYLFAADRKVPLFEALLGKSKHPQVRAAMLLALGKLEFGSKNEDVHARGKARLEKLEHDYKDLARGFSTYGAVADAQLRPHAKADLAIGKPAPEITGADHEGKSMKLSDWKGKVVVLDFWGFW